MTDFIYSERSGSRFAQVLFRLIEQTDSQDPEVRATALFRLGLTAVYGQSRVVQPMLVRGLSDSEPVVRRAALETIAVNIEDYAELIPRLMALRNDPAPEVRSCVRYIEQSMLP